MPSPIPSAHSRPSRFGGLDGLRAIAVGMVLCYHLFPTLLPGGFLGVDVFFAISGFLITSLLIREYEVRGSIDLATFWRRRARRLLPALGLVLLVCTSLALLVGGDLLVGIGAQFAGAAFFVSNWVFIATGSDYFTRDNPELFRNTWSLSIEEQFYIVLPLLLILLVFRMRSRATRALPFLALGAASAMLMAAMSVQGAEATRIYFGSDTHTFGLLLGTAVALLTGGFGSRHRPLGTAGQIGVGALALAGFGVLGWLSLHLGEGSSESFQGGFQFATIAALAVVWSITRQGAWIGRALDAQPLRWVGERSYGLYLWHWPLLVFFTALFNGPALGSARGGALDWRIPILTLVGTVLLAALSYRFVEQPVRRIGLRRSLGLLFRAGGHGARQRSIAIAMAAVVALTVPASVYAMIAAPSQSSAAAAIERGRAALEASEGPARKQTPGSAKGSDAGTGDETGGKKGGKTTPAPPVAPEGGDISAIGDSVMLASTLELQNRFPDIAIDAAVSRGMGVGVGIASDQAAQGILRRVLVVGLGTNGPVDPTELDALHETAGDRLIVLVNAYGERDWIPGVNQTLEDFADAHRGIVVADWDHSVAGVPDALAGDGIHPNPSGGEIYADSVEQAFDALQQPGEAVGYALPRR